MPKTSVTLAMPASINRTGKSKADVSGPGHQTPRNKPASVTEIWRRAYQKWEAAGSPAGDGVQFWSEAAQEILKGK